jgi:hypothetical protein
MNTERSYSNADAMQTTCLLSLEWIPCCVRWTLTYCPTGGLKVSERIFFPKKSARFKHYTQYLHQKPLMELGLHVARFLKKFENDISKFQKNRDKKS